MKFIIFTTGKKLQCITWACLHNGRVLPFHADGDIPRFARMNLLPENQKYYKVFIVYMRLVYGISINNTMFHFILKGATTLMISTFYKKELLKPWILILGSSKSVEKWEIYGHLKNSIWPILGRHFEYLISF